MTNTLVRYNGGFPTPFNRDEFLTPFSSLFDEFFNSSFPSLSLGDDFFRKGTYPKVDVIDEKDKIIIEAEVPGLSKDQVSVEIDNGVLRIKGEKQESQDKETRKFVHKELKRSSFCRSFVIGDNINKDELNAKFDNGILTVTLPKIVADKKLEQIKKIEIK